MKKITKIILILIISTNITFAQNKIANKHSFNSKRHTYELRETNAVIFKPGKELYYSWDSTNAAWIYWNSALTLYNAIGNPTRRIVNNSNKDSSIYNTSGYIIKKISYFFNGVNWETTSEETYTYNIQNQVTSDQTFYYTSGSISSGFKDTNTYNGNSQQITKIYQELNNGMWVDLYKSDIFYPGSGEPDKLVNYQWDTFTNVWQKTDSIINLTFYNWTGNIDNSPPSSFINASVTGEQIVDSFYYDALNNQIKFIQYKKQGSVWVYYGMQTDAYTYDGNNSITQQIQMIYQEGTNSQTIANSGAKWVYSDFNSYSTTGIINSVLDNNIILYPNPNSGVFHLQSKKHKLPSIVIYNLVGENIYQSAINNPQAEIDLSTQPKGVYFLQIIDENKNMENIKIIIQ